MRAPSPLPLAPRPCPGEILSSWLSRVACRYGQSAKSLIATLLFPDQEVGWHAPLDWGLSEQNIMALAHMMRLDVEAVAELDIRLRSPHSVRHWFTWREVYPDLFERTGDKYSNDLAWNWCPQCLAAGFEATGQDYIRRDWVSAYASYCQVHRRPLTDVCACGFSGNMFHVSEGAATKLYCRGCFHRLVDVPAKTGWDATRYADAVDLQLAFEHDLASALNGVPIGGWCGNASSDALLTVIDNVAHALCTRAAHQAYVPIQDFDCFAHPALRFHPVSDIEHKLSAIRPFWRWRVIAATLAVIGNEETCMVMSRQRKAMEEPLLGSFQDWRGSFEWLLSHLTPFEIGQLGRKSPLWPGEVRERFFLAAAQL